MKLLQFLLAVTMLLGGEYETRRDVLIARITGKASGIPQQAAAKGIAMLWSGPSELGAYYLEKAAMGDPKCSECCDGRCGDGAGYWALPLLVRGYYLYGPDGQNILPQSTVDKIKGFYRSYLNKGAGSGYGNCDSTCTSDSSIDRWNATPYAYISQSDNHCTIQASAILLGAQMLKGEGWDAVYEHWRAWWDRFMDVIARRGFGEPASPTYVERHLAPIYNIYEFSEDPLLRKKAEMLIDAYWAEIALDLLNGVRGGAKLRVYGLTEGDRGALLARNDTMYPVYWLYTGMGDFPNGEMPNAEMLNIVFATSSYRPPDVVLDLATGQKGTYEVKERRKGACFWWDALNETIQSCNTLRYSYVTPDYVLGSFQSDSDKQFMPWRGGTPHLQSNLVFATGTRIAWGESGYIGSGYLDSFQYKNVVIVSKFGLPNWGLGYDLPDDLDYTEQQGNVLFVREGNAYAALRAAGEVLIIEAASSADWTFADFKARILQLAPSNVDQGFVQYTTADGDVLRFPLGETSGTCRYSCNCNPSDDRLPTVNGARVDWQDYPLFGSPYVQSDWDSGLIQVVYGDKWLTLDFRDPGDPTKREGTLTTPTPTSTPTPTRTNTLTPVPTSTSTPTLTATSTQTASPTATVTASPTPTPTPPSGNWWDALLAWLRRLWQTILDWFR